MRNALVSSKFRIYTELSLCLRSSQPLVHHIYMATTDRGSNESLARRTAAAEVMDSPNIWFLDQNCLEHAPHLVVLSGLLLADTLLECNGSISWKYWSSLAMFGHTSRDQARDLYETYAERYGAQRAKQTVKCLMPRPVSQRWGRIHDLEDRIMKAGFSEIAICMAEILTRKFIDVNELRSTAMLQESGESESVWEAMSVVRRALKAASKTSDAQKNRIENDKHATPNELSVEQTKEFTLKMGRWRARTLQACGDRMWGMVITVMNACREPLIHISNFLKQTIDDQEVSQKGSPLCQLVYGKADAIFDCFTSTLRSMRSLSNYTYAFM